MKKNKELKKMMETYNAARGIERKKALEQGTVWTRPTMTMNMKTKYARCRNKKELRRQLKEAAA